MYDIPEFVGYKVDHKGNIWSFWIPKHRKLTSGYPRILKPLFNKKGYASVCLMKNGKRHTRRVNRLVCEAFHGLPPSTKHEAAHINGIRSDNRAINLTWKTKIDNMKDMNIHGTKPSGEKHGRSKITSKQVAVIRKLYSRGKFSGARIGRKFGLTRHQIYNIVSKRQWRHIDGDKTKQDNYGDR